jgi:GntR family transcriptional regulator
MGLHQLDPLPIGSPLFKSIKHQILTSLESGTWRPGESIPSEKKLAEQMGVSIGTLRKAIDELVDEEVLIRHQGRGTFVSTHDSRDYNQVFFRLAHIGHGQKNQTQHIKHTTEIDRLSTGSADGEEAADLQLEPGADVVRARIFHFFNGIRAAYDQVCMPAGIFPDLNEGLIKLYKGNLYQMFQDSYYTTVLRIKDKVSCQSMGPQLGEIFSAQSENAILRMDRVAWSYHSAPVERRTTWIDPRTATYTVEATQ